MGRLRTTVKASSTTPTGISTRGSSTSGSASWVGPCGSTSRPRRRRRAAGRQQHEQQVVVHGPDHVAVEQRVHGPGGAAQRAVEPGQQLGRALGVGRRVVGVDHRDVGAGPRARPPAGPAGSTQGGSRRRTAWAVVATPVTSSTVATGPLASVPGMDPDAARDSDDHRDPTGGPRSCRHLDRASWTRGPRPRPAGWPPRSSSWATAPLWVPEAVGREPLANVGPAAGRAPSASCSPPASPASTPAIRWRPTPGPHDADRGLPRPVPARAGRQPPADGRGPAGP